MLGKYLARLGLASILVCHDISSNRHPFDPDANGASLGELSGWMARLLRPARCLTDCGMDLSKWFIRNQPQTLRLAQGLLYMNAAWGLIGALSGGISLLGFLIVAGEIGGAYGIANSRKVGYRVAIGAAIVSFFFEALLAVVIAGFLLRGYGINVAITLVIEIGLLAALFHSQTREYVKVWFE